MEEIIDSGLLEEQQPLNQDSEVQKHSKEVWMYFLSHIFERAGYYGIRSLMVLYMIDETLTITREDALSIYGWFTASLIFSKIIGGLLGDLVIGNRRILIIGGIICGLGAIILCIPSVTAFYAGIILLSIGSGFHAPNILAQVGKLYVDKPKLMDSGFVSVYTAANVGAFFGVALIGYIGSINYIYGFIVAAAMMFLASAPIFLIKEKALHDVNRTGQNLGKQIFYILSVVILVGIFWGVYEVSNTGVYQLQMKLKKSSDFLSSINSFIVIALGIVMFIVWTFRHFSGLLKLSLGFMFASISFGLYFLLPENISNMVNPLLWLSALLLGLSEIIITPVIHSVLTKNVKSKYLAIIFSLAYIPTSMFSNLGGIFSDSFYDDPLVNIGVGVLIMGLIAVALFIAMIIVHYYRRSER